MKGEQEPRTPDTYYNDQLMNGHYDQDEELHKVILQSRQEYMEHEQQRLQKEEKKKQLQERLAVPMARLSLWKRVATEKDERECLHHILNVLYIRTHTDRDDEDAYFPDGSTEKVRLFLDQHLKKPPLFQEAYHICLTCLHDN